MRFLILKPSCLASYIFLKVFWIVVIPSQFTFFHGFNIKDEVVITIIFGIFLFNLKQFFIDLDSVSIMSSVKKVKGAYNAEYL